MASLTPEQLNELFGGPEAKTAPNSKDMFDARDLSTWNLLKGGAHRSIEGLKGTALELLPALGASLIGKDKTAKEFLDSYAERTKAAEEANPTAYKSYKDVMGPNGSVIDYAAELLGETGPDIASFMMGTGIGSMAGKKIASTAAKKAIEGHIEEQVAKSAVAKGLTEAETTALKDRMTQRATDGWLMQHAANHGAEIGSKAGLFGTAMGMSVPDTLNSVYQDTGNISPVAALTVGSINGILNTYLPAEIGESLGVAGKNLLSLKLLEKSEVVPTTWKREVGKQILKDTAMMGVTSGAQAALNKVADKIAGSDDPVFSQHNIDGILEATIKGATTGALIGAPLGMASAGSKVRERQAAVDAQKAAETKQIPPSPPAVPPEAAPVEPVTPPPPPPPVAESQVKLPEATAPEPVSVQASTPAPSTILSREELKGIGLTPNFAMHSRIRDLDMANADHVSKVDAELANTKATKRWPEELKTNLQDLIAQKKAAVQGAEDGHVRDVLDNAPTGESVPVSSKPEQHGSAERIGTPEAGRMEPSAEPTAELGRRKADESPALEQPKVEPPTQPTLEPAPLKQPTIESSTQPEKAPTPEVAKEPMVEPTPAEKAPTEEAPAKSTRMMTEEEKVDASLDSWEKAQYAKRAAQLKAEEAQAAMNEGKPVEEAPAAPKTTAEEAEQAWNMNKPEGAPSYKRLSPDLQDAWHEAHVEGNASKDMAEQIVDAHKAEGRKGVLKSGAEPGSGTVDKDQAAMLVNNLSKQFPNLNIKTVHSIDELPSHMQRWLKESDAEDARGFLTNDGKTAYIITGNHNSLQGVRNTVFHEALGHYGLRKLFRNDLDSKLEEIYNSNRNIKALADKWLADNPNTYKGSDRIARGAEEALAEASENNTPKMSAYEQLKNIVRKYLRKMGLVNKYSDNDVKGILRDMHEKARSEGGDVAETSSMVTKSGKGKEPLNKDVDEFRLTAPSNIAKLPPSVRGIASAVQSAFFNLKSTRLGLMLTEDVAELARKYMPSVADYVRLNQDKHATIRAFEENIRKIVPQFEQLSKGLQESVNKFIGESTFQGKWGYDPGGIEGVKVDPEFKARFDNMPPKAQAVIRAVFDHGVKSLEEKKSAVKEHIDYLYADELKNASEHDRENIIKRKKAELEKFSSLLNIKSNDPYAPLKRFGEFIVVGKSKEYYEAEKNHDWSEVSRLRKDGNHYVIEFAQTMGEAQGIKDDLAKLGKFMIEDPFKRSEARDKLYGGTELHTAFAKFRRFLSENRAEESIDENRKNMLNQMDSLVQDLYLTSLAESSARKSEFTRQKIAGYNQDMMRAFFTQGMADARFIANLKHNSGIFESISRMQEEAKDGHVNGDGVRTPGNRAESYPYLNELLAREAQTMQIRTPSFLDSANRMVGDWFLTFSPSFYLQQATQTYAFSLPWMGARFGYFKSNGELMRSYGEIASLLKKSKIGDTIDLDNLPKSITKGERAMLDHMVKTGLLDIGIESTLHNFRTDKGVSATYTKTTDTLRGAINKIEVLNRATTALATYRLSLERNKGNEALATKDAYDGVRTTHGSYDGFNTPRLFNSGPVARSVTQFRRFQIIQLTMLAKQLHNAFKGETPEMRAIGRKEAMFLIGHCMALGGAKGLPFWALASTAYSIINSVFGDDDTKLMDLEAFMRDKLKDTGLELMLTKGMPAALGYDASSKLGMGNVTSISPFAETDLTSKSGYEKAAIALAGPFAGGMLPNMADGVGMLAQGDYYKGLEKFMPSGAANAMKAYRFSTDGITNKNGDMVMSPEDISFTETMMQAVGLPPTKFSERTYRAGEMYKAEQYFTNTEKNIIHNFVRAAKENDMDSMSNARQEFLQLQNVRAANGLPRQNMSVLHKGVEAQKKREHSVVGGVETNKQNARFARGLTERSE